MQIRGFGAAGRFAVGLVAGYAVAVAALAALLIVLGGALAERTGANRQVYPSVGFSGVPVLADFGSDVSLDFLDDDLNLPRRFSVPVGVGSGTSRRRTVGRGSVASSARILP